MKRCVAKIMPLRERKVRACGKPGQLRPDGRVLCPRHEMNRKRREKVAAEAATAQHEKGE